MCIIGIHFFDFINTNIIRNFNVDASDFGTFQSIDDDLIMNEIEWFESSFNKEIKQVKSIYGESNCKVQFVFCTYAY